MSLLFAPPSSGLMAAHLSAAPPVRSAVERFGRLVAWLFLAILEGVTAVARCVAQDFADAAAILRYLFARCSDQSAPPDAATRAPKHEVCGASSQSATEFDYAAFMRTESPHWRLYYDVFRALHEADPNKLPSIPVLKAQLKHLFDRHTDHQRPPLNGPDASASAANVNSTFFTYDDEGMRLAYYISRVPKHAVLIGKCLQAGREHIHRRLTEAAAEGRPFVVASFGGGPSSDLFGFLTYLDDTNWFALHAPKGLSIVFHVFDIGPWEPFWAHIAAALPPYYPSLEVHFHTADLASRESALLVPPETRLLLFSYFMVEMTPFADDFAAFFTALVSTVRPDALFVALESPTEAVIALRGRLKAEAGLTVVLTQSDPVCISYLCMMPNHRTTDGPKWIDAVMHPQLEFWQLGREDGGRMGKALVWCRLRGRSDRIPSLSKPPPLAASPSTFDDTASWDSA